MKARSISGLLSSLMNVTKNKRSVFDQATRAVIDQLENRRLMTAVSAIDFDFGVSPHAIRVSFDSAINPSTLSTSDLFVRKVGSDLSRIATTSFSSSINSANTVATFTYTAVDYLPDGDYVVELFKEDVLDSQGQPLAVDASSAFAFLYGDLSGPNSQRDRTVNVADKDYVQARIGTQNPTYGDGDMDASGTVTMDDVYAVMDYYDTSLLTPVDGLKALTATPNGTAVELTWARGSKTNTGFRIQRSTDGGRTFTTLVSSVSSTTESYLDSTANLAASGYVYRVRSIEPNQPFTSIATPSRYFTVGIQQNATEGSEAIVPPESVEVVSAGKNSLTLSWEDASSDELGFEIYRSDDNGTTYKSVFFLEVPDASSWSDSKLKAEKTYYYKVRTRGAVATSGFSNVASETTLAGPPSVISAGLSQTDPHEIAAEFDQPILKNLATLNEAHVAVYALSGNRQLIGGTNGEFTVVDSTAGEIITVRYDGALSGTGILPNGNYEIIIRGDAVKNAAGQTISDAGDPDSEGIADTFFLKGDFNRDRLVSFDDLLILAQNYGQSGRNHSTGDTDFDGTVGFSDLLAFAQVYGTSLAPPPNTVGALSVDALNGGSTRLTWNLGTGTIDGYRVFRSIDGVNFDKIKVLTKEQYETVGYWDDKTAQHGQKYYYRVRAFTFADGNGISTDKSSVTTQLPGPSYIEASPAASGSILVRWQDNSDGETGFIVYRRVAPANPTENLLDGYTAISGTLPPDTISYLDTTAVNGTEYQYMVVAVNIHNQQSAPAITPTPVDAEDALPVYSNDFEDPNFGGSAGWQGFAKVSGPNSLARSTTPIGNRHFLGQFVNDEVTLSLSNLPDHDVLSIDFDLFIINSWDGQGTASAGPDHWAFKADGVNIFDTTFRANYGETTTANGGQSYPNAYSASGPVSLGGTGAEETNTLGFTDAATPANPRNNVYRLRFSIPHSASSVTFSFRAYGLQTTIQNSIRDESWGIDNVSVGAQSGTVQFFSTNSGANGGLNSLSEGGGGGVITDLSAGSYLQLNGDYDEMNVDGNGNLIDDRSASARHPQGQNWRLFGGHWVADTTTVSAEDSELMHATLRLKSFPNSASGKVRYGIIMPSDVKMWQWWPTGNSKSANAHRRTNPHWGLVIGNKYSRPVTPNQDIIYRVEGLTSRSVNDIKVFVFDADADAVPELGIEDIPAGANGDPVQLVDTYPMTVQHADLDADTDGNGVLSRNVAEELAEDDGVSSLGVPLTIGTIDPAIPPSDATKYARVRFEIDGTVDLNIALFEFDFGLSGFNQFRFYRDWTGRARDESAVDFGGDLIPAYPLTASQLGLSINSAGNYQLDLFVRAIADTTPKMLRLFIDPDGDGSQFATEWEALPVRIKNGTAGELVSVTAPSSVLEGGEAQVTVSAGAPVQSYFFDWDNDNQVDTGELTSSAVANVPDSLLDDGPKALELHAGFIDMTGGQHMGIALMSVTNVAPAPAIVGIPATLANGQVVTLTSSVVDPSDTDTSQGFAYLWTLTLNGTLVASSSPTLPSITFTATQGAGYLVMLRVTDKDGGVGTTELLSIPSQVIDPPVGEFTPGINAFYWSPAGADDQVPEEAELDGVGIFAPNAGATIDTSELAALGAVPLVLMPTTQSGREYSVERTSTTLDLYFDRERTQPLAMDPSNLLESLPFQFSPAEGGPQTIVLYAGWKPGTNPPPVTVRIRNRPVFNPNDPPPTPPWVPIDEVVFRRETTLVIGIGGHTQDDDSTSDLNNNGVIDGDEGRLHADSGVARIAGTLRSGGAGGALRRYTVVTLAEDPGNDSWNEAAFSNLCGDGVHGRPETDDPDPHFYWGAYNTVAHLANTWGLQDLGLYAYSHGASSARLLTQRLHATWGGNWPINLRFTGYIDAVRLPRANEAFPGHDPTDDSLATYTPKSVHGLFDAVEWDEEEYRFPYRANYFVNIYQRFDGPEDREFESGSESPSNSGVFDLAGWEISGDRHEQSPWNDPARRPANSFQVNINLLGTGNATNWDRANGDPYFVAARAGQIPTYNPAVWAHYDELDHNNSGGFGQGRDHTRLAARRAAPAPGATEPSPNKAIDRHPVVRDYMAWHLRRAFGENIQ